MKRLRIALVLFLPLAACAAPGREPAPAPPPPTSLGSGPPTWDKLAELEAWLDGEGPAHYPEKRAEAELELAEGRLSLAKKDVGKVPQATLGRRLSSAESGFRRVLGDPASGSVELGRARDGLDEIRRLRAPAPAPSTGLAVKARSSWGARAAMPARMTPERERYSRITVHHSAPPNALPANAKSAVYADEIRRLQRYHMEEVRPVCGDIGYHFLIDPNGVVYEGRSLSWQGAHAGGANNQGNIGICVLGDFNRSAPTTAALSSLARLIEDLRVRYKISRDATHILGHRELKATECPGDRLMAWVESFR